jgi:pimeloyl-ACP methyl ester carboxylesterase
VKSLLLVHGAGSGPWAFAGWEDTFLDARVVAVDLQAGLDVARASIDDYAAAVLHAAEELPRPLALVGWSLGGLVAMVAARRIEPAALVLLDASPPLEVQGLRDVEPQVGTFDPVEHGARPPAGMRHRRESSFAMGQRDRGVSVQPLPAATRVLVAYGAALKHDRGPVLAAHLAADELDAGDATHWDLVRSEDVRRRVAEWLRAGC